MNRLIVRAIVILLILFVIFLVLFWFYRTVSEVYEGSGYQKKPLSREEIQDLLGGDRCIAERLRERLVDGDEPVTHFEMIRYRRQCSEMKILRNQREALK